MEPATSGAVELTGSVTGSGGHEWRDDAACLQEDPELFFPEGESERYRSQIAAALQVCAVCEVAESCLRYALEADQRAGIWCGTTARTRRGLAVVAGQIRPIRRGRTVPPAPAAAAAIAAPVVLVEDDGARAGLQRAAG